MGEQRRAVVRGEDAEELAGGVIRLLAGDERVTVARSVLRAGTPGVPPHHHREASEVFLVLRGRLQVLLGEELVVVEAGDSVVAEPGVVHALGPLDVDAELLVVTAPATERPGYYRLLDRVQRGDAPPGAIAEQQERFDVHFGSSAVWDARRQES